MNKTASLVQAGEEPVLLIGHLMKADGGRNVLNVIVALVVLGIFGLFVLYMMNHIAANETQWNRAAYIYGGVEAIAFAAAGFLFGREVNRQRAENAEKRAEQNQSKANAGQTLAELIRAKAGTQAAAPNNSAELLAIAQKYFP